MEQSEENKPKWLLELENRKRKPRLAHETGAGAPCLTCESTCPGLDLHFWRKICKNCKCRGDDHDIDDVDFPQFQLLFGNSVKNKKNRSILLLVSDKKQTAQAETPFEWVPPDTTKELAADYMKALPSDKMPIKGSAGAALRRQQLQKQLPLHDIDHKACVTLTDQERKEFEKYLDNLKNCAGQGKVSKLTSIRPFDKSLMTPANATDVQQFSPQHSKQLQSAPAGLNLRTPSSFIQKIPQPQTSTNLPNFSSLLNEGMSLLTPNLDIVRVQHLEATNEPSPGPGRYRCTLANVSSEVNLDEAPNMQNAFHSAGNSGANNGSFKSLHFGPYHHIVENITSKGCLGETTNILGASHSSENLETNTSSLKNFNSEPYVHTFENIFGKADLAEITNLPDTYHFGSNTGVNNSNFKNPNSAPHQHNFKNISAKGNTAKTFYVPSACHLVDYQVGNSNNQNKSNEHLQNHLRNLEFLIDASPNALIAQQMLSEALQPPSAINSSNIVGSSLNKEGLSYIRDKLHDKYSSKTDNLIPVVQGELDHLRYPMLNSISEDNVTSAAEAKEIRKTLNPNESKNQLTFKPPYLPQAEGLQANVDTSLSVQTNLIHSEKLNIPAFPYDPVDFSATLQNPENISQLEEEVQGITVSASKTQKCQNCCENVHCGAVIVTAEKIKDAVWHPGCFVCSACNELLVDLVYFIYKGKLYCGRDLAKLLEIPRCFACDELIFIGEYTAAEGHNYHVKHFCCWDCDIPLAGQKYISENDRPLCLPCYQNNYAKTCNTCNKVIAADQQGITIKNLNFHVADDCFCCFTCNKSLFGGQIAIKEDKPLCSKECIAEFLQLKTIGT